MLIRHLAYFVTLAEQKHFAKAAEACNVAQPTLSAAIRKLEEDLNATLIVRGHRYLGLTTEGERVLEWGRQILFDYQNMRKELAGASSGLVGTLRLGVVPAAMPSVSLLSRRFNERHPEVQIEIRSMTSRAIQLSLDTFEIDGGLTYLENEPLENVAKLPLYHERYVFACRVDHQLAGRKTIDWADAVAEPLCLLSTDMQNRRILDGIVAAAGLTMRAAIVSNSFVAIGSHIRDGHWCSIVPHTFFRLFGQNSDLYAIDLVNPHQTQLIGLVTSDRTPQSPMTKALVDVLRKADFSGDFGSGVGPV